MRTVLLVIGIIAIFMGAIWCGQGTGAFPYPSSSFMVNQTQWIYHGVELALVGLVLIVLSQRGAKKVVVEEEVEAAPPPPADENGTT